MIAINCDLGEWENAKETQRLMRHIQQANVACGVHAGGEAKMELCASLAQKYSVDLGMHPGVKGNEGRGSLDSYSSSQLIDLITEQYQKFLSIIGKPKYIKLHGSLYHHSETHANFREKYIQLANQLNLPIMALAGGAIIARCSELGQNYLSEAFLDRNYTAEGNLVPRDHPQAMLDSIELARSRISDVEKGRGILTLEGTRLMLDIDSCCIHSDSKLAKVFFKH